MTLIFIGSMAFLFSYLVAALLESWGKRGYALDIPNERSSHVRPMPRGGGLGIVLVTLVGLLIFSLLASDRGVSELWPYIAGALLVAAVGWTDDLQSLPFWLRLLSHGLSAILVILFLGFIDEVTIPVIGDVTFGWLGIPLTFLLIVGLINAYNFMDGIDGMAGLQGTLAGFAWMTIGLILLSKTTSVTGLLIGAAALGFLIHNWPPSRIFMGDVGSTFLGFTFAVLITVSDDVDSRLVLTGLLILWPFIFDSFFTFLRRLQQRQNIFEAHRTHLYQRLVIGGYSHTFVTLLYALLSLIGILIGIAWYLGLPNSGSILLLGMPLLASGLYGFVLLVERRIIGINRPDHSGVSNRP